jgi:hypothetical protein
MACPCIEQDSREMALPEPSSAYPMVKRRMFVQKAGCFRLESFQNITELSKTAVDTAGPNKNRSCGQFNGSDAGGRVSQKRRSFGRVGGTTFCRYWLWVSMRTSRHAKYRSEPVAAISQTDWPSSIRTGGRYWSVREPSVAAAYSGDGAV